jgi:predicted XRE-type DNA-binding protein
MEKTDPVLIADLHERIRLHVLATVKSRQITQKALAERVGVQQAHVSNFLLGRRGLSIEAMDAILNALGIDVMSLIAMSEHAPGLKNGSNPLETVPMVQPRAAMKPTFSKDDVLGELGFSKALLRRLKPDQADGRAPWIRFIAVRVDTALAAPMFLRFVNGSVLLIDRHYCSLANYHKDEPNLYVIRKGDAIVVRSIETQGNQLCLRPEGSSYPLDFLSIDRKNPLTSFVVGRVAQVTTET